MPRSTSAAPLTLAALLLAGMLVSPAHAQEEPVFDDFVEVSEILLDVLVTDRQGRIVTGLVADDFLVKENGQPVEVTSVSFYTTRYDVLEELPEAERAGQIPWSRFFLALFHDQRRAATVGNRLMQQQMDAGRDLTAWVEEEMLPSDWLAVLRYDVKLRVHQDFTQDRETLKRSIDAAVRGLTPTVPSPEERRRAIAAGPSLWRHLPPAPDLDKQSKRIYPALELLAEATGYIVGRKNLLVFTIGLGDEVDLHGRPDPRFYPDAEKALNHHNVAVYPIDLSPPFVQHTQRGELNQIAIDTGGDYFFNLIDFRTPLRNISEENIGYYLLSYQTEHPAGESGYRSIRVKTKYKALRVKTRSGYRYGSSGS